MHDDQGQHDHDAPFNPFPGLRPFEPDEDHLFFGRERETDALLKRLRTNRFVSVLGTSGSGKSSLVRCGLIPSLQGGFMVAAGSSWRVAMLRPGGDPIGNLARALNAPDVLGQEGELAETQEVLLETTLRRSALGLVDCVRHARLPDEENLLVIVDQFEELFRFKRSWRTADSRDQAVAFAKLLLAAADQQELPLYVVITMRSDFIGDCMEYPGLPDAINEGQYLIPRMTRDELRAAITGPVAVGGGEIAPRLTARLLNEVGDDPDQLPVLQHALMRTWDRWEADHADDEALDVRHYEAIGTMADALSRHADEAYEELPDDETRRIAERMFKALTDLGQDQRGVRRPTAVGEIAAICEVGADRVGEVAEHFRRPGRSFLVPPPPAPMNEDTILDLSHESLMRCWARLRDWVEEEATAAKEYRRLCRAARRFEKGQAGLWVDPELELGLQWRHRNQPTEAWTQRYDPYFEQALAFLDRSRHAKDERLAAEERARQAKLRRARILAGVLGSAALITLVFGVFAVRAEQSARAAERRAEEAADASRQVADFLVDLFEVADPEKGSGENTTAREILDAGASKIDRELAEQPEIAARLKDTIGMVYRIIGATDEARRLVEEALATRESVLGPDHPDVAASLVNRSRVLLSSSGDMGEATGALRRSLEIRERAFGPVHLDVADSLFWLGSLQIDTGPFDEAHANLERALAIREELLGPEDPAVAEALGRLGAVAQRQGEYLEARSYLERSIATFEAAVGTDDPRLSYPLGNLGNLLNGLGEYAQAQKVIQRVLELDEATYGPEHRFVAVDLRELGTSALWAGRYEEARELYDRSLKLAELTYDSDSPMLADYWNAMGSYYYEVGRYDDALAFHRRAYRAYEKKMGTGNLLTGFSSFLIGEDLRKLGDLAAARPFLEGALTSAAEAESRDLEWWVLVSLGELRAAEGDTEQGLEMVTRALGYGEEIYSPDHPDVMYAVEALANINTAAGNYDEAAAFYERALDVRERRLGPDHPYVARTLREYAELLRMTGDVARADELETRARAIPRQTG